jgi:hypothetical protein
MPVPVLALALGLMFSAVLVSAPLPALVPARAESLMTLAPATPADLTKPVSPEAGALAA